MIERPPQTFIKDKKSGDKIEELPYDNFLSHSAK